MQLVFLGSGSAFCTTPGNFQSNMLLTSASGKRLLIDCGTDIRFSLSAAGLTYGDVDDIYISHLHSDHVGGLEYMGFSTRFDASCEKPGLIICESIVDDLWSRSLSGGMSATGDQQCTLADYFLINAVPEQGSFEWEGVTFTLVITDHVVGDKKPMNSYGLFFTVADRSIYLTADTRFCLSKTKSYLEQADLIFHDCETSADTSGVHSRFEELSTLPTEIRNKIWLYHFDDGSLPEATDAGFKGFVRCGQVFDLCLDP